MSLGKSIRIARNLPCAALVLACMLDASAVRSQTGSPSYGENQSPINIVSARVPFDPNAPKLEDLQSLNNPLTFTLKNTSWGPWCGAAECVGSVDPRWGALKAYPPEGSAPKIRFNGQTYTLVEFHFHSPAEHIVDGGLADMEVHFVFKKDAPATCAPDQLLVIGRRIVNGDPAPEVRALWDKIFGKVVELPVNSASHYTKTDGLVLGILLRGIEKTYRYQGSLTAPAFIDGCGNPPGNPNQQLASGDLPEVVSWVLLADPIAMLPQQIGRFQTLFPNGNARAPQALLKQNVKKTFTQ
ncbi:MAG TPA: carbonic anhydrase family protein [Terracidiphilus sp.]|jgi:carbonic anhydrase|nr:carbonic anhydrase family protein [Terracidiphilus sp.]